MINRQIFTWATLIAMAILCGSFIGILEIQGENHVRHELFLKRIPTLQIIFHNPYRSALQGEDGSYSSRMDQNGDWLPNTDEFKVYLEYCLYRHGIVDGSRTQQMKTCKVHDAQQ